MSRRFKTYIPLSEQYGKERAKYYPVKEDSPKIDYFDPDE